VTGSRLLFLRDFQRLQGGHLKVWHYHQHALAAGWDARISFTERSVWDDTNPWVALPETILAPGEPFDPDVMFVAGHDWERIPPIREGTPVINLIQHVRHADPSDRRYAHLAKRAVRICVSPEVADAINLTGRVRGPVLVIPNGFDNGESVDAVPFDERSVDILLVALRQADLGARVASRLDRAGRTVRLLTDHLPRKLFLGELADARVVVVLPDRREGFCLPALEALALGAVVVVPDVVGNRSFCFDKVNCLMPEFEEEAVVLEAEAALALPRQCSDALRANAAQTARAHSLEAERESFLSVLAGLDELWATA
jgi:hypothetical protein